MLDGGIVWLDLILAKLSKAGLKPPLEGTWTVLAAIIQTQKDSPTTAKVVALGTGVKCLPQSLIDTNNSIKNQLVRDSHAEVLARRALIRYIIHQMALFHQGKDSIFEEKNANGKICLKTNIEFGMLISQAPCGEASMHQFIPRLSSNEEPSSKRNRTDQSIRDNRISGHSECHLRGVLRTKPGRRDAPPTLSHSCSDKLALWSVVGWQGALLAPFLETPLLINRFVIGTERFDEGSLETAITKRMSKGRKVLGIDSFNLEIIKGNMKFPRGYEQVLEDSSSKPVRPSPVAQVWWEGGQAECLIDGKRQGSAKIPPNGNIPLKLQSSVSTENLFQALAEAVGGIEGALKDYKQSAKQYQDAKHCLFVSEDSPFIGWQRKEPQSAKN